jgi:cytochrome b6-f complex iron-sulfur subunit
VPLATVPATVVDGALTVVISSDSPLAAVGGAALTQTVAGGITRFFLLARLTPTEFSALNAVCTHEGCTVSRFAAPLFVCPCHGSRYSTSGEVVQGPAPAALPRYPNEFGGGVLSVRF